MLGPLQVVRDGQPVAITSRTQRLIVSLLAAERQVVSKHRLIDAIWSETPPPSADASLLGYISRLRSSLGAAAIETCAPGYRLQADQIDAEVFIRLVAVGTTQHVSEAATCLRDAGVVPPWLNDRFAARNDTLDAHGIWRCVARG